MDPPARPRSVRRGGSLRRPSGKSHAWMTQYSVPRRGCGLSVDEGNGPCLWEGRGWPGPTKPLRGGGGAGGAIQYPLFGCSCGPALASLVPTGTGGGRASSPGQGERRIWGATRQGWGSGVAGVGLRSQGRPLATVSGVEGSPAGAGVWRTGAGSTAGARAVAAVVGAAAGLGHVWVLGVLRTDPGGAAGGPQGTWGIQIPKCTPVPTKGYERQVTATAPATTAPKWPRTASVPCTVPLRVAAAGGRRRAASPVPAASQGQGTSAVNERPCSIGPGGGQGGGCPGRHMPRRASNRRATLRLSEAESRARIPPEEGQRRETGTVGSGRGQTAKRNGQLGSQVSGRPTTGTRGKGGSNGQRGSGYAAVQAEYNSTAAAPVELGSGLAGALGPGGGSQALGMGWGTRC